MRGRLEDHPLWFEFEDELEELESGKIPDELKEENEREKKNPGIKLVG